MFATLFALNIGEGINTCKNKKYLYQTHQYNSIRKCKIDEHLCKSYPCTNCNKQCCGKCMIIGIYQSNQLKYYCKYCASASQYQYLFHLIACFSASIFNHNSLDITILQLITDYSFTTVIKCNNELTNCFNTIHLKKNIIINTIMDNNLNNNYKINKRLIYAIFVALSSKNKMESVLCFMTI
eukprot:414556_1